MAVVVMLGLILVAAVMAAMRRARDHELGIVLLSHIGELLQKTDRRLQFIIAVIAPGRHAGHLDPVFQNPEQLRRCVMVGCMRKIGGLRVETTRDVAFGDTRRAVTHSAMRGEVLRSDEKFGGIIKAGGHLDAGGMKLDRARARRLQDPAHDGPIWVARGDVEKTRIDEREPADNEKTKHREERDNKVPNGDRPQNQTRTPKAKRKSPVLSPSRRA
jgi:hypothetical protein